MSHCHRKQTQVSLPTSQNQSQSWCCSQSRETPVSQLIQSQKQTVTLKQTPLTHQTQSQTVNLSRQRQTQSQKQTQVTGRGISNEHEKQNKKTGACHNQKMNLQMVYLLIEATPCNCIYIELLKKMMKELEQNKEELRKIKESFDSKLEELRKEIRLHRRGYLWLPSTCCHG